MKKLLTVLGCLAALAVTLLTSGCNRAYGASGSASPPNGKSCTIQFRRDALGAAANLPVAPMTSNINGAETSLAGTLKFTNDEWVVLVRDNKEIWIPKSVILLIHFQ